MTTERFPVDVQISKQDFQDCGWKAALADSERDGYMAMHISLSAAVRKALDEGRSSHAKVLWLLADACSMTLRIDQRANPFAFVSCDGRRTSLLDDYTPADLEFLALIVEDIDDVWLRARIADLLHVGKKVPGSPFALMAIDAYRSIPLDTNSFMGDGARCWRRALSLALMLRAAAGDRVREIEASVLGAFEKTRSEDGFLGIWLIDILYEQDLGVSKAGEVAGHLEELGEELSGGNDFIKAREFYRRASQWYRHCDDESKAVEMVVKKAETWVSSAQERLASEHPSHMVAAGFYEKAIQILRTIPRKYRPKHRVDERMEELRILMAASGELSLNELTQFRSDSVDLSDAVYEARAAVLGKSPIDALGAFSSLCSSVTFDGLKQRAEEEMKQFPLQFIFPTTHLARDGRVIAKSAGSTSDSPMEAVKGTALWNHMIRNYLLECSLLVQARMLPALEVLALEHRLSVNEFFGIATNSSNVPPGREKLWAIAMNAGYEGNFAVAIHVLCPQVEELVRYHLKNAGVKTTNLDREGIENEVGLSTLMDMAEAETIFGKNLSFEIKVMFCDATGPNLRNEIAHGLVDDSILQSSMAMYAWWLAFKMMFTPFWDRARKVTPLDAQGDDLPEEEDGEETA